MNLCCLIDYDHLYLRNRILRNYRLRSSVLSECRLVRSLGFSLEFHGRVKNRIICNFRDFMSEVLHEGSRRLCIGLLC